MSSMAEKNTRQEGRLRARPMRTPVKSASVGMRVLEYDDGPAEGYLYVPAGHRTEDPSPLVLLLHGAGEDARDGLAQLRVQADEAGIVLLACSSRGPTWDLLLNNGRYGPDIAAIDLALGDAFSRCAIDPERVGVGGYSDGASYALALGLANGDLFSHVLAFSPGFLATSGQRGSPRVFVSHGTRDGWLPIEACSRRIVPRLQRAGYEVRYREFEGGHVVPPALAREAASWFAHQG
jgi:phospholipase/carboxylesterase